ncbi:hypothetical protein FJV83_03050 [Mesorhizobium sp. WSM4307]|uniref:hypothetical protein n=1 Tax=unclassified Mesorhizobium TaxID=325217 RepID=UPI000BB02D8B|nr:MULTISPECIES: hypothetical protein [unclassified Mesorhizobium]PBB27482.1 hypothetical protein CK232_04845 [Mesorhizobium sp. WSM4304]PBB77084.1 hypothetical protein CK227_00540 [Mesorhizobium sp. WSM4308]TRC79779.1 hypothetical protein FJV81_06945 [Mesorhizobium sp. WSM4315]TRC88657.1 hypothetical protein FJV83_03050 [Mesorhizobium sp. WSM4307]TRC91693.1 hypothetical protein FJV80_01700 [Mesorhizobium sp. WSM4310]
MRTLLCGVALSAVIVAPAVAETRYDRSLEKAAMGIIAGKMGDIRGGFSYKQVPQLVVLPDPVPPPATATEHPAVQASGDRDEGLSPAIERQVPRTIF